MQRVTTAPAETLVSDALFDYLTEAADDPGAQVVRYVHQLLYDEPRTRSQLHEELAATLELDADAASTLVSNVRTLGEFSGMLENRSHVFSWPIDGFYMCPSCDATYRSPQDDCRGVGSTSSRVLPTVDTVATSISSLGIVRVVTNRAVHRPNTVRLTKKRNTSVADVRKLVTTSSRWSARHSNRSSSVSTVGIKPSEPRFVTVVSVVPRPSGRVKRRSLALIPSVSRLTRTNVTVTTVMEEISKSLPLPDNSIVRSVV